MDLGAREAEKVRLNPLLIGAVLPTIDFTVAHRFGKWVSIPFSSGQSFQHWQIAGYMVTGIRSQSPSHRGSPSNFGEFYSKMKTRIEVSIPFSSGQSFQHCRENAAAISGPVTCLNPLLIGAVLPTQFPPQQQLTAEMSQSPSHRGSPSNSWGKISGSHQRKSSQSPSHRGSPSNWSAKSVFALRSM